MTEFSTLGLSPKLLAATKAAGLSKPTPIQSKAIPHALEGRDVMGLAQTGTGKTFAFGLPLVDFLLALPGKPRARCARSLILAPTRELVNQIAEALRGLAKGTGLRITVVVGGQSINKQIRSLESGTDILVATPGRLIDLMDRKSVDLSTVRQLVLDEADQMLDMGFIHALRRIAPALGTPRQTMLFSATMPKLMEDLSRAYLTDPVKVQVSPPGKAADKITQGVHFLDKGEKPAKLRDLLSERPDARTLVFARTKHGAERLMKGLVADGYAAASIHGNKSQGQRDRAIKGFREGAVDILVATDVAARGIDIPAVTFVVNYDLPNVPENYVHRIGRTARAGRDGEAMTLCAPDEADLLNQVQKLMKLDVPVISGTRPTVAPARRGAKPAGAGRRGGARPGGRGDAKPGQTAAKSHGSRRSRRKPAA